MSRKRHNDCAHHNEKGIFSEFVADSLRNTVNSVTNIQIGPTANIPFPLSNISLRVDDRSDRVLLQGTIGWRADVEGTGTNRSTIIFRVFRGSPAGQPVFSTGDSGEPNFDLLKTTSFTVVDTTPLTGRNPNVSYFLTAETPSPGSVISIIGPIIFTAAEIDANRGHCYSSSSSETSSSGTESKASNSMSESGSSSERTYSNSNPSNESHDSHSASSDGSHSGSASSDGSHSGSASSDGSHSGSASSDGGHSGSASSDGSHSGSASSDGSHSGSASSDGSHSGSASSDGHRHRRSKRRHHGVAKSGRHLHKSDRGKRRPAR